MQIVANTTARRPSILSFLLALFARRPAAPSFCLYIPGQGLTGEYASVEDAEAARCRLPYSIQQSAMICDADGCALCC